MSVWTIILIILILALVGALPIWGYSAAWGLGFYPSGALTLVAIILLVLLLTGRL